VSGIGFGIIGCGAISSVHAKAIAEVRDARLVAVADVSADRAEKLAEPYAAAIYTDYREMLGRDDLHAVSLCVPSGMRAEIAEACAAAGKHILAEKPIEVNTARIDRIISAADRAGVALGCIFQSRFAEGPLRVHEAVEAGRFGRMVLGDAYTKWHRPQSYYDQGAWRGTRQVDGGGALMNQGIHQVDLLLWFMGEAESVQARTGLLGHSGLEVEDTATAVIQFKNGAHGVMEATTASWPGLPARVEVHGTHGCAVLEDGALRFWQFQEEAGGDEEVRAALGRASELGSGAGDPLAALSHEGHRRQIADFVDALLHNRKPAIDGREARHAVALIEAVYKSAANGGAVTPV
jgi:UDP-N-acetyl-2-amino-2-deoxyglucuronate dehydrogenase